MIKGFYKELVKYINCPLDDCELILLNSDEFKSEFIAEGVIKCKACNTKYPIKQGILSFLSVQKPAAQSTVEMGIRDTHAIQKKDPENLFSNPFHATEMLPTLEYINTDKNKSILELGCGTGRYTSILAEKCKFLVGIDISFESLKKLADRLEQQSYVGLIQADITQVSVKKSIFDIVFSTLVSNLPTTAHVHQMFKLAVSSLKKEGQFTLSTHHYTIFDFIRMNPKSGTYKENKIFRYFYYKREILDIAKQYFRQIKIKPIQFPVPLLGRLGLPILATAKFLSKIPTVKNLGQLLILSARSKKE